MSTVSELLRNHAYKRTTTILLHHRVRCHDANGYRRGAPPATFKSTFAIKMSLMLFISGTGCWLWGINRHQLPISIFINRARLVELLDTQHRLTNPLSTDAYVHLFFNAFIYFIFFCTNNATCSIFPLLDTGELIRTAGPLYAGDKTKHG